MGQLTDIAVRKYKSLHLLHVFGHFKKSARFWVTSFPYHNFEFEWPKKVSETALRLQSNSINISLGDLTDFVEREDILAHPQQDPARFLKPLNIEYSITDKTNIEFERPKKDYEMQF